MNNFLNKPCLRGIVVLRDSVVVRPQEIAQFVPKEMSLALVLVSDLGNCNDEFDAVVMANTQAAQKIFDALIKQFSKERIFCYRALGVVNKQAFFVKNKTKKLRQYK